MRATLRSVNCAVPGTVPFGDREVPTGIFKKPTSQRVWLARLGLAGDFQADLQVHGGPEKAAYVYPSEHYLAWKRALGREDLDPGFFGENFTTEGLDEDTAAIGDSFRVGGALVQVTNPRSPCFKLAARVGSPTFLRTFLQSGRVGFYLRVLEEGEVGVGDEIQRVFAEPQRLTVSQMVALFFSPVPEPRLLERALRIATLDESTREFLDERLRLSLVETETSRSRLATSG